MMFNLDVVCDQQCILGEGPVWDHHRQLICWVDIMQGEIHEWSPVTEKLKTLPLHQMIGTVALCANGQFLSALKNGIAIIDPNTGMIEHLVHPEAHIPDNRYNDGKCDARGRFWVGSMSVDALRDLGTLYMMEAHKTLHRKIENTTISNGLGWSPDNRFFYYIDTPTLCVVSYEYDLETANITNKTIAVRFNENEGSPDGMTVDEEGMLWIAHWGGWQVSRWNPFTGEKLFSLPVPVAQVTSCAFGGKNLQDLYITSAKKGLTQEALHQQPLAGSLFVWKNGGYKGMQSFEFNNQSK